MPHPRVLFILFFPGVSSLLGAWYTHAVASLLSLAGADPVQARLGKA